MYAVCSQLSEENDSKECRRKFSRMKGKEIADIRHQGFNTTLEDISNFEMAPCGQLDYTWAWLALQFIGADPVAYGVKLGVPDIANLSLEDLVPEDSQLSYLWSNPEVENTL